MNSALLSIVPESIPIEVYALYRTSTPGKYTGRTWQVFRLGDTVRPVHPSWDFFHGTPIAKSKEDLLAHAQQVWDPEVRKGLEDSIARCKSVLMELDQEIESLSTNGPSIFWNDTGAKPPNPFPSLTPPLLLLNIEELPETPAAEIYALHPLNRHTGFSGEKIKVARYQNKLLSTVSIFNHLIFRTKNEAEAYVKSLDTTPMIDNLRHEKRTTERKLAELETRLKNLDTPIEDRVTWIQNYE